MIAMTLRQVAEACGGRLLALSDAAPAAKELATGAVTDTRQITGGEVFVAIPGARVDGASLAGAALKAGAVAVITANVQLARESGASDARIIEVSDPVAALGQLARVALARLREVNKKLVVVGITGSVGKTTTKDLLAALLAPLGEVIAPPGSFNNEIGLPLTVLKAGENTACLVLEMGADHIGNIAYLASIAPPDISVVLAVARAHLGEFGGIENVARAKSEIVAAVHPKGLVVLNAADARVRAMARLAPSPVRFFGDASATASAVYAEGVTVDESGRAAFELVTPAGRAPVHLGLIGAHHVSNALAAATVADYLGVPLPKIAKILSETGAASPHRMDVKERAGITLIDDSYNANPDSMRAGIDALARLGKDRRKIAVLGAMLELGEASDAEHAAIGEYVAKASIDVVVTVGDGTERIAAAAEAGGTRVYRTSLADAEELVRRILTAGDVVLFKGSNGSGVWRLADALVREDG